MVIVTWKLRFVGGGNFAVFENISVEKKTTSREAVFGVLEQGFGLGALAFG